MGELNPGLEPLAEGVFFLPEALVGSIRKQLVEEGHPPLEPAADPLVDFNSGRPFARAGGRGGSRGYGGKQVSFTGRGGSGI